MTNTAVLLLSSPISLARKGVVASISQSLIAHHGSVLHTDDHVDGGQELFLSRLEWDLDDFDIAIADFEEHCKPVTDQFQIKYHLALMDYRPKIAILVSGYDPALPTCSIGIAQANWRVISGKSSAAIQKPNPWLTFTKSHFTC